MYFGGAEDRVLFVSTIIFLVVLGGMPLGGLLFTEHGQASVGSSRFSTVINKGKMSLGPAIPTGAVTDRLGDSNTYIDRLRIGEEQHMTARSRWLRRYLVTFGLLNVFVISFTIPLLFGDLLLWQPRNLPIEMMLSTIYLAMGIFMIAASKTPLDHKSFIDFLILANLAHALVRLITARNWWHLVDVVAIGSQGYLPLSFYPWGLREILRYPKA